MKKIALILALVLMLTPILVACNKTTDVDVKETGKKSKIPPSINTHLMICLNLISESRISHLMVQAEHLTP